MSDINKTYVFETVLISGGTSGTTAEFITGATFNSNTGILGLDTISGNTINVPLDGRYAYASGHTHDISEITGFTDNSANWDLAYNDTITGMTVTGSTNKTITLTQRDGDTITANFNDNAGSSGTGDVVTGMTFYNTTGVLELRTLSGDTITENLDGRYLTGYTDTIDNDYVTGATFNIGNGVLEFTRLSGDTFNVDLDNRYSLTGHTHTVSEITDFPTDLSDFTNDVGYLTAYTDTNIFVTGGTFNISNGELIFTNISGGTFNVDLDNRYSLTGHTHSEYLTGYTDNNNYITGATFNSSSGDLTLTTVSGDTIIENLDGRYLTGFTATVNSDDYITGATFNLTNGELTLTRLSGSSITVDLDDRYSLIGHTHPDYLLESTFNAHTGDTSIHFAQTAITITESQISDLGSYATANDLTSHTSDSSIHFDMSAITVTESQISDLQNYSLTDHTHNLSELNNDVGFITGYTFINTDDYVTGGTFNVTNGEMTFTRISGGTFNVDIDGRYSLTGHTHVKTDITDLTSNVSQWFNDAAYYNSSTLDINLDWNEANQTIGLNPGIPAKITGFASSGHTHDISEITGFTDNSANWDLAYNDTVTGMTVTGAVTKTITLEQRDGSTITANFTDGGGSGGSGDVVTGMTFFENTGLLELRTLSGSTIQENLDGRYSLTGHTHNLSELNNDAGFITGATSTADDYLSGGTFDTDSGDLDLIRLSGETVTINLDGRYFLAGPVTFSAETSGTTTYVGYGTVSACKIRKIDTISGYTYTAYWSEGSEDLDKLWDNRYSYSYF